MKRRARHLWCLVMLLALVLSACAPKEPAPQPCTGTQTPQPVHIRFASHDIGGTAYTQAATIAAAWRVDLPKGSTIDVLPYSGGIGNIKLIEAGEAELGTNISVSDRWAVDGTVIFDKKAEKLTSIAGGTDVFYMVFVAREATGLTSIADVKEKKYPVKLLTLTTGSTGEVATRHILEAHGMSYDDIKSWGGTVNHTGFAAIIDAMKDGRADVFVHGVGLGHPSMTEIALSVPVRIIPIHDVAREYLADKYGYGAQVLPAGSFKGQEQPIETVAYYLTIVASRDLPEDIAYSLTKAMAEKRDDLIKGHVSFKVYDPAESWKPGKIGAPLHPGAEKYYREQGFIK